VRDEAMLVPGFEHHILSCPSCHDEETRLVFIERAASLSPCAGTDEIKAQVLDAPVQPVAAAGAEHEAPKEITIVRSDNLSPIETLPPALPTSLRSNPRPARSPSSRVWGLKAELHRARWEQLCGRLGLRLSSRKPDTPTGS
jgi:hypothetical protein